MRCWGLAHPSSRPVAQSYGSDHWASTWSGRPLLIDYWLYSIALAKRWSEQLWLEAVECTVVIASLGFVLGPVYTPEMLIVASYCAHEPHLGSTLMVNNFLWSAVSHQGISCAQLQLVTNVPYLPKAWFAYKLLYAISRHKAAHTDPASPRATHRWTDTLLIKQNWPAFDDSCLFMSC